MEAEGASVEEVSLPHTEYGIAAYYIVSSSEASTNLARYDGVKYGFRADAEAGKSQDLIEMYGRTRDQGFGTEVKRRVILGAHVLSAGYYDEYYNKASQVQPDRPGVRAGVRASRSDNLADLSCSGVQAGGEG